MKNSLQGRPENICVIFINGKLLQTKYAHTYVLKSTLLNTSTYCLTPIFLCELMKTYIYIYKGDIDSSLKGVHIVLQLVLVQF